MTVKDLAEMFPERFSNKTNGVLPPLVAAGEPAAGQRDYGRDR